MPNKVDSCYRLLKEVSNLDEDLVRYVMGDFGVGLKDLAGFLDLKHPEIYSMFEDLSSNDHSLIDRCLNLIRLVKYAKSTNCLEHTRIHDDSISFAFKGKLLNKMSTVRFLKDESKRHELRLLRTSKLIDLSYLYGKAHFWLDYPASFSRYQRYDSSYKETVNELNLKKKVYLELGYNALAEETESDITSILDFSETYHGYHQIKSVTAAMVFARNLGLIFNSTGIFSRDESKVYRPILSPIHEIIGFASNGLKKTVSHLESFPGTDNRPLFDLLALLVPTFSNSTSADKPSLQVATYFSEEDFRTTVLLGEKNKKFYFIRTFP